MTLEDDKQILRRQKLQAQGRPLAIDAGKNEYTFSSSPRALYATRKMAASGAAPYANVMFEKRVFRGSNFAAGGGGDAPRAARARRRAGVRERAQSRRRLGSPPAVAARKHERVQTEVYLEELFVNPPVRDTCTQTDLFLERPVSPFYVPAKTGADAHTQIYAGDLFDFDMEVQPILEVLVGKTVEQALIEVLEEEELAALRVERRRFLELRAAETAEALRLEQREKRLGAEKRRRVAESAAGLRAQRETEERVAAAVLAQGYMADLLPAVLEGLRADGHLVDGVRGDLEDGFLPWLVREVGGGLREAVSSRDVLAELLREMLEDRAEAYRALEGEGAKGAAEEGGAAGPTAEELMLREHLRLREEISEGLATKEPPP